MFSTSAFAVIVRLQPTVSRTWHQGTGLVTSTRSLSNYHSWMVSQPRQDNSYAEAWEEICRWCYHRLVIKFIYTRRLCFQWTHRVFGSYPSCTNFLLGKSSVYCLNILCSDIVTVNWESIVSGFCLTAIADSHKSPKPSLMLKFM